MATSHARTSVGGFVMSPDTLYRLSVVAAALVGTFCAVELVSARIPAVRGGRLLVALALTATVMLAGARLYGIAEAVFGTPTPVAVGSAGQRQPGAILAALLCFPLIVRRLLPGVSALDLMDAAAPAVSIGFIFVRIGCLVTGCCYGTITDASWAVEYGVGSPALSNHIERGLLSSDATASIPVHPLAAYFGVAAVATAWVTYWYFPRRRFAGEVVLVGLMMREGSKAFLESYREIEVGAASTMHLQAVSGALAILAGVVLVVVRLRSRSKIRSMAST